MAHLNKTRDLNASDELALKEFENFEKAARKLDRERHEAIKAIRTAAVMTNFRIVFGHRLPISLKFRHPSGEKILGHDTSKMRKVKMQRRYLKPILKIYQYRDSKCGHAWLKKHTQLQEKMDTEIASYDQPLKLRPTPIRSAVQGKVTEEPLRTLTQLAPYLENPTASSTTRPISDHLNVADTHFFDIAMGSGVSMRGGDGSFHRSFSINESVTQSSISTASSTPNSPVSLTTTSIQSRLRQTPAYKEALEHLELTRTYRVPRSVDQIFNFRATQDEIFFEVSWLPTWISKDEYFFQQPTVRRVLEYGVSSNLQSCLVEWKPSAVSFHYSTLANVPLTLLSLALNNFIFHSQDTEGLVQEWLDHTHEAFRGQVEILIDEAAASFPAHAGNIDTSNESANAQTSRGSSNSQTSGEISNTQTSDEGRTIEQSRLNLSITIPQRQSLSPLIAAYREESRHTNRPIRSGSGDWIAAFSRDDEVADRGRQLVERELVWRLRGRDVEDPVERGRLVDILLMFRKQAGNFSDDSVNMRGGSGGESGLVDDQDPMEEINIDEDYIDNLPDITDSRSYGARNTHRTTQNIATRASTQGTTENNEQLLNTKKTTSSPSAGTTLHSPGSSRNHLNDAPRRGRGNLITSSRSMDVMESCSRNRGSSTSPPPSLLCESGSPATDDDNRCCNPLFGEDIRQVGQRIKSFFRRRNSRVQTRRRYDRLPFHNGDEGSKNYNCCCCVLLTGKIKSFLKSRARKHSSRQRRSIYSSLLCNAGVATSHSNKENNKIELSSFLASSEASHEESSDSDPSAGAALNDNDEGNTRDDSSPFASSEASCEEGSNSNSFQGVESASDDYEEANINHESSPLMSSAARHEASNNSELAPPTLNTSIPSPVPRPIYPQNEAFEGHNSSAIF